MISIIVTTQRYMVTPPVIRTVLTNLIMFKMNRQEWLTIKKEHLFCLPVGIETVLKDIFTKPFNFLMYRIDNGYLYFNFKKILF